MTKCCVKFLLATYLSAMPYVTAHADTDADTSRGLAREALKIWQRPSDKKAIERLMVGKWQYIAAIGYMKDSELSHKPEDRDFFKMIKDFPKHFIGRTVSFYPNKVGNELFPGLKPGSSCVGASYVAKKELYGEYEVPDKAYVQASLAAYLYQIDHNESITTMDRKDRISKDLQHALQPFPDQGSNRGWIIIKVTTTCKEPGTKAEESHWIAELSRGGYFAQYLVDGLLILKKIDNNPE